MLEEDVGIWFCQSHGPVGTEGVYHDKLIDPADTLQTLLNQIFAVVTGNDAAYFLQ